MANNAIIAKSRAVSGTLLKSDDYRNLAPKGSVAAAVGFLKTRPYYRSAFADTDEAAIHRDRAEALVNRSVFENYMRILKFASGDRNGIMSFFLKQLEKEQLIKAVISVFTGEQESFVASFPQYIAKHLCFDPYALAETKSCQALAAALKNTPYARGLTPLLTAQGPDINRVITEINCTYIEWAFRQAEKSRKKSSADRLKSFFLRKADADNLLVCYRMKNVFSLEAPEIYELLLPFHYRLKTKEIDDALKSSSPSEALRALLVRKKLAASGGMSVSESPEIGVNAADMKYFRHELSMCTDEVQALYSLVMLMQLESINVCRIIEGIRYSLSPDVIEKYLIIPDSSAK